MKTLLILSLLFIQTAGFTQSKQTITYQTEKEILASLKNSPTATINGPFLLKIQSITKSGFNTHLNTEKDEASPQNIVLEIPPFMATYYTKQFKSKLDELFLNQTLTVNGKLTPIKTTDPETNKEKTIYLIKIFLGNQLAHYQ